MIILENAQLARYLKKLGYRYKEVRTLGVFNKKRLYGFVFREKKRLREIILAFERGEIIIP